MHSQRLTKFFKDGICVQVFKFMSQDISHSVLASNDLVSLIIGVREKYEVF